MNEILQGLGAFFCIILPLAILLAFGLNGDLDD